MVATDARLTQSLYALWPWLLLDDPTMEAALELLCVYTANCTTGLFVCTRLSVCLMCLCRHCAWPVPAHRLCLRLPIWLSHTHFALRSPLSSPVTTEQHCVSLYKSNACLPASHNGHSVRTRGSGCVAAPLYVWQLVSDQEETMWGRTEHLSVLVFSHANVRIVYVGIRTA